MLRRALKTLRFLGIQPDCSTFAQWNRTIANVSQEQLDTEADNIFN